MKISSIESGKAGSGTLPVGQEKILPKDMPRKRASDRVAAAQLTPLEQGIAVAEQALEHIPDTRDDIVEDIRKRIEAGEYKVSGEEIADMMMRRRAADRLR